MNEMYTLAQTIQDQVKTVILGKDAAIQKVLMAILAKGHILLEDVPGVGKTTLALSFARVLGLDTRRIQFTPDTMPSDIVGFSVYDKATGQLRYQPGAVMTNRRLWLSCANVLSSMTSRWWMPWRRSCKVRRARTSSGYCSNSSIKRAVSVPDGEGYRPFSYVMPGAAEPQGIQRFTPSRGCAVRQRRSSSSVRTPPSRTA